MSAGSPRSQPSLQITTTAPRAMPRTPHWSLKSWRLAPSRVPPDQSRTDSGRRGQGGVGVAAGQLPGDPGQAGAHGEHLDPARTAGDTTAAWAKRARPRA